MMNSLASIEPEVLSLIFEFVVDTSPQTVKAIACVNKYFNALTKLIAHRHKTIFVQGSISSTLPDSVDSWNNNETVLANIRTLTVRGWVDGLLTESDEVDSDDEYSHHVLPDSFWSPLETLLSKIGKLRVLNWNIKNPISLSLLKALETHQPAAKLCIWNFTRASSGAVKPDSIELRLGRSPALTHIRYSPDRAFPNTVDLHELAFRSIVATAPKLEYAGFLFDTRFRTYSIDSEVKEQHKAQFYKHTKPNSSVRQLTLDGVEISKQTLDDWSTTVDLTSLQNVKFSRGCPTLDYFQNASNALTNLKHLSLNLRVVKEQPNSLAKTELVAAIRDYIVTCSPLKTLSLWSWIGIIPLSDMLDRHGPTLNALHLHEREVETTSNRDVLTPQDVQLIRTRCPDLNDLTFDINRTNARLDYDEDPSKALFEELGRFSNLGSLQIYLDVGAAYLCNCGLYEQDMPIDEENYSFTGNSEAEENEDNDPKPSSHTTDPDDLPAAAPGTNSSTTPPPKRQRITSPNTRPSRDTYLIPYAKNIWTTVFAHRSGRRHLDIKVGEWETGQRITYRIPYNMKCYLPLMRHMVVRPHERDDIDEPTVKLNKIDIP